MTTMATHIAGRLAQDATINSVATGGVYDYDIRRDGPEAHPEVTGPYGFLLPHIIVDDVGGTRAVLGPTSGYQDRVSVYLIAEASVNGRASIETLAQRVLVRLHLWQEVNTKAAISYADRTGYVADPPPATGAMEVMTFVVAGVFAGLTTS